MLAGFQGAAPGSGAALQAPVIESRADVARLTVTAQDGRLVGSMGGRLQRGEDACGGTTGEADAASHFLGPELQQNLGRMWLGRDMMADDDTIGGSDGRPAAAGRRYAWRHSWRGDYGKLLSGARAPMRVSGRCGPVSPGPATASSSAHRGAIKHSDPQHWSIKLCGRTDSG